jgi:glycosyltransferase involved in cell wall biosynthesis
MTGTRRRILYVINAFESDAPTRITMAAALGFRAAGWEVAMVAWSRGGPTQIEIQNVGIPTAVLAGAKAISLARYIRRFKPAIVHSILARPILGTLLARAILPGRHFKWIAGDHGIHEWQERDPAVGALMNRIMPIALCLPDAITTVSYAAARQLTSRGVPPTSIHVIPNGVDPQKFYPRPRAERCAVTAAHFPADDPWEVWPLMGSAGNLRPVMPGILHKWPKARLIIWGDGPERQRLQQLARDFKVDHAVSFAGHTGHLEKLLPLLDLYVQPSFEESFGLAAAEGMCCGTPAILSDAGGLPELANHGTAAWVFPARQRAELAAQMSHALENKPRLKTRGAAGRGWILQNYTISQMIGRTERLYLHMMDDSPASGPGP